MTIATDVRGWHRPLLLLTVATTVLAVVAGIGIFADPRILTGVPIWLKPFKFAISFSIYAITLAWLLAVLPRRSRFAEWAGTAIVAVTFAELGIVTVQAARGRLSHYNEATPLDAALWQVMGIAIMVLFFAHLIISVVALRQRISDQPTAYAIRLGLGLSLLGLLAAVPMVTPMQDQGIDRITGAHTVGLADGGPGMPLTGWSTVAGDLRIGHFVGLHALQAMPLLAFLLSRFLGRRLDATTRARLLLVAGAAYGLLTVLLTWQALRAQPLLRPDALTLAAATALLIATVTATGVVVRRSRRPELALAA